ncbi:hypothetical protein F5Y08DRAFT_159559 [Xylaria arbuscula]|nr:hypothetical protein F5Y08DRAFT_159559 [Xylaria arbuscula]
MDQRVQYKALRSREGDQDFKYSESLPDSPRPWHTRIRVLLATAISLALGLSCFYLGRYVERSKVASEWFNFPGMVETEFIYQKSFALAPGNESDASWQAIFPEGLGFVQHPEIAPEPMGLSVFHQLHCLDGLRRGYWGAGHGAPHGSHEEHSHVRHCIDYIRQSLMCHADTNLEPINFELGGVTGFDSPRRCRDIAKVKEWAEVWAAKL